jgi:hypothetical protein
MSSILARWSRKAAERSCGLERRAVGRGSPAKTGKSRPSEAVDHRAHVVRRHWKQAQRGVLDELDQHAAAPRSSIGP